MKYPGKINKSSKIKADKKKKIKEICSQTRALTNLDAPLCDAPTFVGN